MNHKDNVILRKMTHDDLELVLEWRNMSAVRNNMFSPAEIDFDQHRDWFERANNNPKMHLMIMDVNGQAAGFVKITQVSNGQVADWSFHIAPRLQKGRGYLLCRLALDYAFNRLAMKKMYGQVLEFNTKSIALHHKLGFKQEGILRDDYYRDGCYHDVFLYGLCLEEWNYINDSK